MIERIRNGQAGDAPTIAGMIVAMAAETEQLRLNPVTVRAGVEAVLADPAKGWYLVTEVDGKVIACVMVYREWSDWIAAWCWWIRSAYVLPDHRRQGVFTRMVSHVDELAFADPEVGCWALYVDSDNLAAQRVYEDLEMTLTGYRVYEKLLRG